MGFLDSLITSATQKLTNEVANNVSNTLRNVGAPDIIKKPDGTAVLQEAAASMLPTGLAESIAGKVEAKATDLISNGVSSIKDNLSQNKSKSGLNLGSLVPNPLEKFSSYTCLFTLSALTPEQFNDPVSYRNSPQDLKYIVFATAGRYDKQRVQTMYGAPEYYVNKFNMKCVTTPTIASGASNAMKFDFEVYEPYGMGTLLQSMQVAAINAGYPNYLQNCPYVLRIDFQGYDQLGNSYKVVKPKFFTMKLTNCKFTVTEAGSVYKLEAIPYNHEAFSDQINRVYTDVALQGTLNGPGTVKDLLVSSENSLINQLNKREEDMVKAGKKSLPDFYEVQFPVDAWDFNPGETNVTQLQAKATADPLVKGFEKRVGTPPPVASTAGDNEIAGSKFGFTQTSGGNQPFARDAEVRDEKTGVVDQEKINVDSTNRIFQFQQGQKITDILIQVVLQSEYAKNAIKPDNITPDGFIKYFKIDIQYLITGTDPKTGAVSKKIIFRILPYKVHVSVFAPAGSAPPYDQLEKKICKKYEYIYTGQNVDVLKFDININNLFFRGIQPGQESSTTELANDANAGTADDQPQSVETTKGSNDSAAASNTGNAPLRQEIDPLVKEISGGAGELDTAVKVARNFHKAFLENSTELVNVNLEILGDTYWIVDNGIGNYFSPAGGSDLITEDGSMNYVGTDVFIWIRWTSPIDIDPGKGLYKFASKEGLFNGIYKVTQVETSWDSAVLKQKLNCIRMPRQASDFDNMAQPLVKELQTILEAPVPAPTSPADPEPPPNTQEKKTA